jgi:alkanesulfonate monooxygenase SsuD/methylene tetrahydromethanopterin reductase-like flavin-dependent oxidoreductase (luciferase family)
MEFGLAPTQSLPRFDVMLAQGCRAEALGFEALWAHEHHSEAMMYPDPLATLATLAGVTDRIRLGTNMLLLPLHHPVRVAQQSAMVDVQSGGRLQLGVANGYSPIDLATFGVARGERGKRLGEGIELIRALWSGDPVTRVGRDFALDGFRLFPVPLQRPGPPIFLGGQAEVAIHRAAKLGDGYLISTTETRSNVGERVSTYRRARAALGLPDGKLLLNRIVCTVASRAHKQEAEQFFATALLRLYDSWGHANVTALSQVERAPERVSREHFVIGEPEECLEALAPYIELGIDHVACLMSFGGPPLEWVDRSLRLFGERVLPELSGR